MRKPLPRIQGFTLLELLVVVALMAIVATVALVANEGVQDEAAVDATKYEMAELRKALLQFRRDAGAFPCGVYNENDRPYAIDVAGTLTALPSDYANEAKPAALTNATTYQAGESWCRKYGLKMLTVYPFDTSDTAIQVLHPLWNKDTKRGWNGPYIAPDGLKDAWGNPYLIVEPELDYSRPISRCDDNTAANPFEFECRATDAADFDAGIHTREGDAARIVSTGPDGEYNGQGLTPCAPPLDANGNPLDLVLCLLK